eukprot:scaffold6174_cov125-Isochrysis_galbana.AAC.27
MLAKIAQREARIRTTSVSQTRVPSQSGMVQPVVNEMFATVHAAGSSLLGVARSPLVQASARPFCPAQA